MSSKTKKTVQSTSNVSVVSSVQHPQQSSTPVGSRPSSAGRPSSPLSPTKHTRLQEKENLQNLNDRLAAYIEKVRHLENENSTLRRQIETTEETMCRETSNIRGMFEHEIQEARRLLDEMSREKAKLEIDAKRLLEEKNELKNSLDKKNKESATNRTLEKALADITAKYRAALNDVHKADDEIKELKDDLDKTRRMLNEARKTLEEEILCRVEMENMTQSLREELAFKEQVHQQEQHQIRTKRQIEISEIDGQLSQQYEAKLQQSLQELRDQYEVNMKANRDEIEQLFKNKLQNLQSTSILNNNAASMIREELREMRTRNEALSTQLSNLENTKAALNNRIRELERELQAERGRHADDLAQMEAEMDRMREDMARQLREYTALMDIKISLDHEIATYRTLLEGEEDRLNLTGQSPGRESRASGISTPGRATPLRATRKRTLLDESEERSLRDYSIKSSAKGDLEIDSICPEGKFVKIKNKGKKEISLGGYQIVRKAGDQETVFKFHRTVKLEPGATATVWSADAGVTHDPPRDIVMKGQKWFVADTINTLLLNIDQEEVAMSQRERRQMSSSAQRHRELSHKYPRRDSGLAEARNPDENCRIM